MNTASFAKMLPRALQRKKEAGPRVWTERVAVAYEAAGRVKG